MKFRLSQNSKIIRNGRNQGAKKEGAHRGGRPLFIKVGLEGEQDREPRTERIDKALVLEGCPGNRLLEINVLQTEAQIAELVDGRLTGRVDDVEEVERDLNLHPFGYFERILKVRINAAGNRRAAQVCAAEKRHFPSVLIRLLGVE